ncbi:MAG: hypothetical protein IPN51_00010 [Chloracidobacterium sp.]|nr:hypothetical protein [Chloracidobacterium sp.]
MAMEVAEIYRRLPRFIRKALIEGPINLLPTSELKKTRIRDVQRFFTSANEDRMQRYYRWMSTFKPAVRDEIYTDEFKASIDGARASDVLDKWFVEAGNAGVLDASLLTDQMTYLPNDLLVKVDIASMANSLEARSPFLDHKLMEFAASLPESLKMNRFRPKYLLKKVAARLVPPEVVYRRKMGFGVPIAHWFRGEMKDFVRDVLLSPASLSRGVFRPETIQMYIDQHIRGEVDHATPIWTLLMLELWYRRFIDQK